MKKFGLLLIGITAGIIMLAHVGPVLGMIIGLAVLYYAFKGFIKAESTGKKVLWGILGFFAISITLSNVPALIGVAAAIVVYLVYKNWNKTENVEKEESDPFTNFEKEWEQLKKNF
ncbi:flagellar basal body rod protein [Bacillus sp. PS06]|uniref:lmo0954 family membrane protein n=1 Tax=Bacillus sp. PS06 TaxID=2764176 RepID=UPI001780BF9E|nr:flagellar basal body rod protein [Bacillus sp. PS06]MBD8070869.1 flagellar basal body rod protein [Bacillus sp. PS06]